MSLGMVLEMVLSVSRVFIHLVITSENKAEVIA